MGWGGAADLALVPISPPMYWVGGLGDVADETEDVESYDLVDGFGDRGYGLCDEAAMLEGLSSHDSAVRSGRLSTGSPTGWMLGSGRSRNMQAGILGACWGNGRWWL